MSRPMKKGLEYFPMDVDMFQDIKVRKLIKSKGGGAIAVYTSLLCIIYRNGYYIEFDDDDLFFLVSEKCGLDEEYIESVIEYCVTVGLFSKEMYDEKVLTSKAIQERYRNICAQAKRKSTITKYCLVELVEEEKKIVRKDEKKYTDESENDSDNSTNNSEETTITSEEICNSSEQTLFGSEFMQQSKVKESKVNIRKENKTKEKNDLHGGKKTLEERQKDFYDSIKPFVDMYGREMLRNFFNYWSELDRKTQTKMRFELQETWEIGKRLATWNSKNYGSTGNRCGDSASPTVGNAQQKRRDEFTDYIGGILNSEDVRKQK